MTPERWQAVRDILEAALERDRAERAAYLAEACGADATLRGEVEALLAADEGATGFLEPPAAPSITEPHLASRLQDALGSAYRVERELGGGGMSRVFVAEETALGRRVVVKVMPPELTAAVDAERFRREVRLAASLQHPHVVPVLAAGEVSGLLYYTMPFIEGESLKERLARERMLSVSEVVRLLREVADALRYAHRRGVVHRDLKPANILLEEGHALVADFGIAKAVSAATTQGISRGPTLTSPGLVLGTPSYMAPEQAAGDPATDHRADLYALGCVAYELLTSTPPFRGETPQELLAAHLTEAPEPVTARRPGVPPALAALVRRLLEKRPAERPQSAEEVLREFEALDTEGASAPRRVAAALPALGLYLIASLAVLGAARVLTSELGLPDWVVPGAVLLLLVGLFIILPIALVQPGRSATVPGARRWLTWRRAISGGVLAFAALGLAVAGYMAMRALGVGPVGTLLGAGVLKQRERILVADFENGARDSTLGRVVTEALRTDLGQSRVVSVVQPSAVGGALRRMQRRPDAPIDPPLAREIAAREGIKAVLEGDINAVGGGYVLTARLIAAPTGDVLAAFRETAGDEREVIPAIDRLSRRLRGKIGESLKTIRGNRPLDQVTTASLEALRKYTQAMRAAGQEGDYDKAIALLEEAVVLDTGFAMAYRKLGVTLNNLGEEPGRAIEMLTRAFQHRDRLTERERYLTIGSYHQEVTGDLDKAVAAYRRLVDSYPDDAAALNNLGRLLMRLRQYALAEEQFRRAGALDPTLFQVHVNLARAQVARGNWREAEQTLAVATERLPDNPRLSLFVAELAASKGDYSAAEAQVRRTMERQADDPAWRFTSSVELALLGAVRGKLAGAARHEREAMETAAEGGDTTGYLKQAIALGTLATRLRREPARGLEIIEAALTRYPLDSIRPLDRPYLSLARIYALAGKARQARALLSEYERAVEPALRRHEDQNRHGALGELALAEGRVQDAIAEFRAEAASRGYCAICGLEGLGRAFDTAGVPDSALVAYESYATTPYLDRLEEDVAKLPAVYRRLGELYEARGNREEAAHYYTRFIELWKDCDPELRPLVAEVRRRLAKLSADSGT